MSSKKVKFDTLRTIAFGSISGTYAAIGSATTVNPRTICITNDTDAAMIVSDDNTNSTGKMYLPARSFRLYDLTTNERQTRDDSFEIGKNVTMYIKQYSGAPTTGVVALEYLYA